MRFRFAKRSNTRRVQQTCDALPLATATATAAAASQVYNGTKALSTEAGDPPAPVNAYGASKLAAEAFLRAHWPRHFSLRSSIIFGPAAAAPGVPQVARALFLQARFLHKLSSRPLTSPLKCLLKDM